MIQIGARLDDLRAHGLQRRTRLVSGPQGPHVVLDGKPVLLLCADNCLGLADHPRVREAAADAAVRWGVGAGGTRLTSGTMTIHRRLEEGLAELVGRESALLFGSRHLAAAGAIASLARPGDVVFSDELNHASLVDGCRLSRAEVFVYDHCDIDHLAWGIDQAEGRAALIVTESVFSIDGDLAPLREIVALAQHANLRTLVDESNGAGALGPEGRGALAAAGLEDQVDVIAGTLGAALGSYGAFVACDREIARYLVSAARAFAASTSLPPPAVAGALAALELLRERPERVRRLIANASVLRGELEREGFDTGASRSHIVAPPVGDARLAGAICEAALLHGAFIDTIRPAASSTASARLRLAAMATHQPEELRGAARTLGDVARA
ncbi:MAG: aminotransferase class I/II-fold pyridoxal phosphate-dependent enzyme, partial [Solirubrobacteraceae bacterium]